MKALWSILLFTTLLNGLAATQAVASSAPWVMALAPVTLTPPQQQQVDHLRQRYGCPLGDSDALAQVVALRQCLSDGSASATDLQRLQQLYGELAAEQGQLQTRVNTVDADIQALTSEQFSTTTRLEGEAVFALLAASGAGRADDPDTPIDGNLATGYRARLNFVTSFTGADRLRLRLQARDIAELEDATGTQMANLGFDGGPGENLALTRLEYETPLGDRLQARFQITGGGLGDFVPAINPLFSGSGDGAISTFGRENPIRRLGGAPGVGLSYDVADWANLSAAVLTPDAYAIDIGLFEERYSAIAQITLRPSDTTALGLTYVRTYHSLGTGTGSELGEDPFDGDSDAVATNAIGVEVAWDLSPQFTLSGRVGYLWATAQDLENQPTAELFTWAASLGLRDLGTEGSLTGLIVGTPPRVFSNAFDEDAIDPNAALHLEAFYRWPLNEYLALTPGLIVVINPEHDSDSPTLYIGTVRATFTF